jgi:hypothetical protein
MLLQITDTSGNIFCKDLSKLIAVNEYDIGGSVFKRKLFFDKRDMPIGVPDTHLVNDTLATIKSKIKNEREAVIHIL